MATRKPRATPPAAPAVPPAPAMPPGYTLRRYVAGPPGREARSGRRLIGLIELVDGKLASDPHFLLKTPGAKLKPFATGHVYDVPTSPDRHTFSIGLKQYVGEYEDKAQVLKWQAEEQAAKLLDKAETYESHHADDASQLEPAIREIKNVYQRLGTPSRVAFEVWLLNSLRKGIYF